MTDRPATGEAPESHARPDRVRIIVMGPVGRMGQAILAEALTDPTIEIVGAVVRPDHPWVGRDLGMCLGRLTMERRVVSELSELLHPGDVVIDFTHPETTRAILPDIKAAGAGLVCGTTGLSPEIMADLNALGQAAPVVWAANMSLGVNVLISLVKQASALLGPSYDLEVLEIHHKHKKDSPSGTALALAAAGLEPRNVSTDDAVTLRARGLIGARGGAEEVGVGVLRGGAVAGEHTVYFFSGGERLELTHRAVDRRAFAAGALRAARWLKGQSPGLYGMADVLGLKSSG